MPPPAAAYGLCCPLVAQCERDTMWVEDYSNEYDRKYWVNRVTGDKVWQKPAATWVEKYSEEHKRAYWWNRSTGESTWLNPAAGVWVEMYSESDGYYWVDMSTGTKADASQNPDASDDADLEAFRKLHDWVNISSGSGKGY